MAISAGVSLKDDVKKHMLMEMSEDIKFMKENQCLSKFLAKHDKKVLEDSFKRLRKLFKLDPSMDIEQEYENIINKTSKLPSNARTVIEFMVLADRYKDVVKMDSEEGDVPEGDVVDVPTTADLPEI